MENLFQLLGTLIEDESTLRIAFVALSGLTLCAFGIGLTYFVAGATDPLRQRLRRLAGKHKRGGMSIAEFERLLQPVTPLILPKNDKERSATRQTLIHAGFRGSNALNTYYGLKTLLAVSLPMLVVVGSAWAPQLSAGEVVFLALLAAAIGTLGPNYVLHKLVTRRQKRLRDGFPDALDLLVVCVESGLGLAAAIQRVADEITVSHQELGEELALVNAEIRAGVDRVDALKNLAARTGLDDIRGLVALLVQSMRFGTSIAHSLRVYSEEFRDKRMQAAEEMAAKIGTKMIFPLVFCFFPAFFLVMVGPAIIRIMQSFAFIAQQ
jgi:tight adherence protein C